MAFLGHIDHGKTSILDKIRQTQLQNKEAGGITQSIGAYQVEHQGKKITFIDTPGHEAFTAMRARGGNAADLVVLVVAADDGVKPQTVEAINHIRAAQAPILVALNKIDLATANPQKALQQLAKVGVLTEGLGGEVVTVKVSAKTGEGIDELLEMVTLLGEMLELRANPKGLAHGVILEGTRDEKKGIAASLIVKEGTLNLGDVIATASTWGKVKRMSNWQQETVGKAPPGTPVSVLGLKDVPLAGEKFEAVKNEKEAQEIVKSTPRSLSPQSPLSPQSEADLKILKLIIKADSQGSLEAVHHLLENLQTPEVKLEYIHEGIGQISETDIMLAATTRAIVLGFRVGIDKAAENLAKLEKVIFRSYEIIYHLLEELQDVIEGEMQEPEVVRLGLCKILEVFVLSDGTKIAGCQVLEGKIARGHKVRFLRNDEIIGSARILSLRVGKEKLDRVEKGKECGLGFRGSLDFQQGDLIESVQE